MFLLKMLFRGNALGSFLITLILVDLFYKVSTSTRIKTFNAKEKSTISVWPKPTKRCVFQNCGPPWNLTITPWPRDAVNRIWAIELTGFAAHDIYEGIITVAATKPMKSHATWPLCDLKLEDGSMLCPVKKGEGVFVSETNLFGLGSTISFKGHYVGNVTLVNSQKELIFCASVDCHLFDI